MNPGIKERWINALVSGEYEQGTDRLRTGDKFCCLGVLCDLYMKEHPEEEKSATEQCQYYSYFGVGELLPTQVVEWAGFKGSEIYNSGSLVDGLNVLVDVENDHYGPGKLYLSDLNDKGHSFKDLSVLIERSL